MIKLPLCWQFLKLFHLTNPSYLCNSSKKTIMNLYVLLGFLGGMGAPEIIVILVIVLLLFGGKKIPELMKGLGQGIKEFKDASKGEDKTSVPEKK